MWGPDRDKVKNSVENIMKRFITTSAMKDPSVKKLMTLSLEENKVSYKNVDVGVKASDLLRKSTASDKVKLEFRMDCITFLLAMTEKIRERSPLKYGLTRMLSCLAPKNIVDKNEIASRRFSELVGHLHSHGKVSATVADRSKLEFQNLCVGAMKKCRLVQKFQHV